MKVFRNKDYFILEVDKTAKDTIKEHLAYRGLVFSTSASNAEKAILFTENPYALADLGAGVDGLDPLARAIEASRALDGKGTWKLPPGKELWPYQKGSLDYVISRKGGLLGDAPGLGKTPMAIAFANHFETIRTLVIVPASLRLQWGEKIAEWSTLPNPKISVMLKPKDGIHPTANYQVLSYESARNPAIVKAIGKYKWDLLICDEAHRMKSIDALTTRAILGNGRGMFERGELKIPAIATHCRMKLALTGTLLLNRPSEAFTLLRAFDHEAIDFLSWEKFKEKYNRQATFHTVRGKRVSVESTALEQELQNRLRTHIMTRHLKEDVLTQMKPPRYDLVRVEENGAVKDALNAEGLLGLSIEEIQTTKDIEILGHIAEARRLMGEAMAPQIAAYAREFLEGSEEKLVIFGWHISVLDMLQNKLAPFGVVRIDGRVSPQNRKNAVDSFIQDDNVRVFLGNIQAAGTGIDGLQTVCSRVYLAEPDWVPAQNEQAVARLDRIGQENVVRAEIFVAPGSLSERILVRALEKMNVIHRVMDHEERV